MKEILAVGGSGYLVPAVLFVLLLYAARGLFGLHGRRSQNRREFLELWDRARAQDDLWLEVAVRHLFGIYLPARIIRLALAQPDRAQSLLDLAELWPLLRFEQESQSVSWRHSRHASHAKRRTGAVVLLAGYFVLALLAILAAVVAFSGDSALVRWVYSLAAVVSGAWAVSFLARRDTIETAVAVGDRWIACINGDAPLVASSLSSSRQTVRSEPQNVL